MRVMADLVSVQEDDIRCPVLLREMEFHLLNVLDITIAWVAGFHAAKYCRWASTLPGEMQQAKVVGRHPGRIRAGEQLAGKVLLHVAHFTEWNGRKLPIAAGIAN